MQLLPVGVAATIQFGPFVDKTDGVTLKTDATTITDIDHASTGIFLSKNGATGAIRHASVTASVADSYGFMKVVLDTTDTNTLGILDVEFAKAATYLPVHRSFLIVPVAVYNSLVAGSDLLDVSVTQLGGVAQSATDLKDFADTGYDPSTHRALADLKAILATELTETSAGYLAAAFKKLFDVATPVLSAASVNQGADNNTILSSGTYGNSALKTLIDALSTTTGVSVSKILNTAITESAGGRVAAAFIKFFDVLNSVATTASVNQGADSNVLLSSATVGLANLKALIDALSGATGVSISKILNTALPVESVAGRDAAALGKFLDVATPLLTCSAAMRGTDSAATAAKLLAFVKLILRSDAAASTDNLTEANEINSNGGSGAGTYGNTFSSQEAIRNKLPTNLEDLSVTDTTGLVKATDSSGNAIAPASIFTGITSLANWLKGLFRKDAMDSTAKTEVNTGGGTYNEATDSQEGIADSMATSANQTTILARIGAFTGTGVNTILGFFKALLSKAASNPSDVGGTFDPATDSTEAIRDRGDAAWLSGSGLDAAGVRAALGMASANMDTQLASILAAVGTGSGSMTVVVAVNDGTNPIDGVNVQVKDSTGAVLLAAGTTNPSGQLTLQLDPATYKVYLEKLGSYTFTVPETMVITFAATKTFSGTALPVVPPAAGCQLFYVYPSNPATTLDTEAEITVSAYQENVSVNPYIISNKLTLSWSATYTRWQGSVMKGLHVIVEGKSRGKRFLFGNGVISSADTENGRNYTWLQ